MNRLVSACVVVMLGACSQAVVQPPAPVKDPSLVVTENGPALPFDHPAILGGGSAGGGGAGGGVTGGGGAVMTGPASAGSQRLSVRQLAQSMNVALGGSTWMVGSVNGFDARTRTLGEPDYIGVVDENLEPSSLFLKFMDDAAKDACTRAVNADQTKAANQRVVYKAVSLTDTVASNASAVDQNLVYLKLRFHGIKVPLTDDATLAPLRKLFDDAVKGAAGTATPTAAHVKEGWRAVCVGLLMAPEYHLY
ncbi:MAG: hypothetical protein GQE15_10390 [Archangiaceae bacterium]|nr:hypothetical protein [Archangiaceae bacterium]